MVQILKKEVLNKISIHNTNQPIVTLQLKDANKFGEVTTEIQNMGTPNNLLVIWMDFQEGDSFEEEVQKAEPKFISAPQVSEPIIYVPMFKLQVISQLKKRKT